MIDNKMSPGPIIFSHLTPYEINKNRVKELYWLANSENQIFINEEQDIYVIRQDEKIDVIGYLHCGWRPWIIDNIVFKFIDDLRKLCKDKAWLNCEITVITDFNLSYISHNSIENLPIDIKYLLLEASIFKEERPRNPELQNLENEITASKNRYRRSKIRSHSDFGIDPEDLIMTALKNGHGDSFGLG